MSDDAQIPSTTEPLDEAGGRALVEAWRLSGLSGAAFCRRHNLRAQRLHYWRERLGYPIKIVGEPSSVPVPRPSPAEGFVQMVVRTPREPLTTHVDIVVGRAVIRVASDFEGPIKDTRIFPFGLATFDGDLAAAARAEGVDVVP